MFTLTGRSPHIEQIRKLEVYAYIYNHQERRKPDLHLRMWLRVKNLESKEQRTSDHIKSIVRKNLKGFLKHD